MPTTPIVLLLACPDCHGEWLLVDTGQPFSACPVCSQGPWRVSAAWRLDALPCWDALTPGRILRVESAVDFLWWLRWACLAEHPSGPIGSHAVTPGMQLVQATAPNGDTTWSWCPTAGSEN